MAGMLPGVEAARRRRIHNNNNNNNNDSRRPSFCLYATTNDSLPKSSTRDFPIREKGLYLYDESVHLGVAAREAKKRLDHRFQSQSTSQINRLSLLLLLLMMASLLCAIMIATKRRGLCKPTNAPDLLPNASLEKKAYISVESKEVVLDATAREAKQRLDMKLQGSSSSENLQTIEPDLPNLKKCGRKRLRWLKLKWKSSSKCISC